MGGITFSRNSKQFPISDELKNNDVAIRREIKKHPELNVDKVGLLFDKNGNPIVGFYGEKGNTMSTSQINVDPKYKNVEGAIFSQTYTDNLFGGTVTPHDLEQLARSKWGGINTSSKQGQMYSVVAGENADRQGLLNFLKSKRKLLNKNFNASFKRSYKSAITPLKSGPNKGKVRLVDSTTGKSVYRDPLTKQQALRYARQYATGLYDRTWEKNLKKFGFTYNATKAGK